MAEIDEAYIRMCTKASVQIERFHFHHGITNKRFLNAKHMICVFQQLRPILGVSTHFLPAKQLRDVHALLSGAITIDSKLHARIHTSNSASELQIEICRWLEACKSVFTCTYEDNDDFGFMKFHFAAQHVGWIIEEYGPLWTTCTGHMEEQHKVSLVGNSFYFTFLRAGCRKISVQSNFAQGPDLSCGTH